MTKVLIFQGSPRSAENCPDQWSKSSVMVQDIVRQLTDAGLDAEPIDLAITNAETDIVRPCKACVSTSKYQCQWNDGIDGAYGCTCYGPGSVDEHLPDVMHDKDIYRKLQEAAAFVVVTPVNWYGPSTTVKAMFDRLVCANLTLTKSDALRVLGEGNLKNAEVTRPAEKQGVADDLLKNHLEGTIGCFIVHGDGGADDYIRSAPPSTYNAADDPEDPRLFVMPLVWQCRYSGIDVPEELVVGAVLNKGHSYAEANDMSIPEFYTPAVDVLIERLRSTRQAAGIVDLERYDDALARTLAEAAMQGEWFSSEWADNIRDAAPERLMEVFPEGFLRDEAADDRFRTTWFDIVASPLAASTLGAFIAPEVGSVNAGLIVLNLFALMKQFPERPAFGRLVRVFRETLAHEIRHAADWAYRGTAAWERENPELPTAAERWTPEDARTYVNSTTELRSFAGNVAEILFGIYGSDVTRLSGRALSTSIAQDAEPIWEKIHPNNRQDFLQRVTKALQQRVRDDDHSTR